MNYFPYAYLLLLATTFVACEKDPECANCEEELITTVELTFKTTGMPDKQIIWRDLDGDGGNSPTITGDTLAIATTYQLTTRLLNESVSPISDITAEVQTEGTEHQLFYIFSDTTNTATYTDTDTNGNPIGLHAQVSTAPTTNTSTLRVVLRHQPNKTADHVAHGDITNAGGETDIDITLPFAVQ